jgi:hypothetical protein
MLSCSPLYSGEPVVEKISIFIIFLVQFPGSAGTGGLTRVVLSSASGMSRERE